MPRSRAFHGVIPSFPTPTFPDGSANRAAISRLVDGLVAAGVDGLVPVGGTGEFTALSPGARADAVGAVVEAAAGRAPVIAGILSPGLGEAIEAGREFVRRGADAVMPVVPFYVRSTQAGVRDYFAAFREQVPVPVMLYDIPRFTNMTLEPETIARMAEDGSIDGIKTCNGDFSWFLELVHAAGDTLSILSGEDRLCPLHVALGATGGVLASATLVPGPWREIVALAAGGRLTEAVAMQRRLWRLFDVMYRETNPGPLKTALAELGLDAGAPRLPLLPPDEATLAELRAVLAELRSEGLLHL